MPRKKILFIAPRSEPNLGRLLTAAQWCGAVGLYLDTNALPALTRSFDPEIRNDSGYIVLNNDRHYSNDISGVWTRGLGISRPLGLASRENLVYAEWSTYLIALSTWTKRAVWANDFLALMTSANKINQLELSASIGFRIPRTLITSCATEARKFLDEEGEIIIKRLSPGNPSDNADRLLFAHQMNRADAWKFDSIGPSPVFLQAVAKKEIELRTIVIGDRVFSAGFAASQHKATSVDTRHWSSTNDSYFRFELDPLSASRAIALTRALGLTYGALDLVINEDGLVTFLELNNAGQWGWIEAATGYPISQTIIEELTRERC
ncbi:hypothetical protein [Rhodanobacter sp. OK091]|uniref:hypothetical protein n=1 Tax=Rhodanobacter sp. OK091 TaxID=1881037 RepID=UPI00091C21CB|nr:hypothetical protein [Rhodanobacter sp. OK091]SHM20372.1 hypothetical protein SAMN05428972_2844 [Rhodanobacter sp. OK091]